MNLSTMMLGVRAAALSAAVIGAGIVSGCARKDAHDTKGAPEAHVTGPEGRLHVDDGGQGGLPVVFVHSFAGSSGHWSAQLAHLRATRRAVAFDARGHGLSDPPRSGSYAVSALAEDIAVVADGLGLKRFVLVGHSMGGSSAIAYAGAHPDRVASLVLVGTPGQSSPEQASRVMTSMQTDYEKVSDGYWKTLLAGAQPAVDARIRGDLTHVPREAALSIIGAIFAYDPLPALRAYPGPKLLVDTPHGEGPQSLHTQAPEIPRKVIEGTSHWPHMDKPDEFNRILDEFLANAS
jgi:pimeloyl-ACP methyl ester carboxylesterase